MFTYHRTTTEYSCGIDLHSRMMYICVMDKDGNLLTDLVSAQVRELMAGGTITGGMIPKLETCLGALDMGVEATVILDGRVPHVLLLETFTEGGVGTLVRAD